jgi:hypothetical protein
LIVWLWWNPHERAKIKDHSRFDEHFHSLGENSLGVLRSGESEQSQIGEVSWWQGKSSRGSYE